MTGCKINPFCFQIKITIKVTEISEIFAIFILDCAAIRKIYKFCNILIIRLYIFTNFTHGFIHKCSGHGSGEKSPYKDMSKSVVVLENLIHWDLKTAVYPIFAKLVFDIFAVSSLVPWINLSHTQQGHLRPKNQNYLLGVAELGFFLSYELGTTIKITIFSTFYVIDNFSSCYRQNFCKKYRLFQ